MTDIPADAYVSLATTMEPMMVLGQDGAPVDLPTGSLVLRDPLTDTIMHFLARRTPQPTPPTLCADCGTQVSARHRSGRCRRCYARAYMRQRRAGEAQKVVAQS